MRRGIDVLNGCLLATSWRTGSKLIRIEVFSESVNAKKNCALRRQTPKRKSDCNWANATRFFLFMASKRPPKKIGAASEGQRPVKTRLTKAVKEVGEIVT